MPRELYGCCLMVLSAVVACMPLGALADQAAPCNPPVRLDVEDVALSTLLDELAQEHDFSLVFPESMDRHVTVHEELALDALLERLTAGISTSYMYADEADCDGLRIVKLVIYPIGEKGEVIRGSGGTVGTARIPRKDRDYIYVEDMDGYVRDVMLKKHGPELNRLTPEQRVEYRMSKQRLKKERKAQGRDGELRSAGRDAKKAVSGSDETGGDQATGKPADTGG